MKGEITLKLFCQSPLDHHPNCNEVQTFTANDTYIAREKAEIAGWRKVRLSSHKLTSGGSANSNNMIDHYIAYACPNCMRLIDRYLRQDIDKREITDDDVTSTTIK